MKNIVIASLFLSLTFLLNSCSDEDLTPIYGLQQPGKVVIKSYSALPDSLQVVADGKALKIGSRTAFVGKIVTNYDFVFYDHKIENIDIVNKATGETLKSYNFTTGKPIDTLSFYTNNGIWINNVIQNKPGVLSATGKTGYRFIFPTMNRYSNSGYNGTVDAIIKKVNGQVLGIVQNINKDNFSNYIEFTFASPPIINVELVKHGTTESYVAGQQVIVQMVVQNNKSKLIVLDEKVNENGFFSGVNATINLVDHFDY